MISSSMLAVSGDEHLGTEGHRNIAILIRLQWLLCNRELPGAFGRAVIAVVKLVHGNDVVLRLFYYNNLESCACPWLD